MKFDVIHNINSITKEDIAELTMLFRYSNDNIALDECKINALNYFIDESILQELDTDQITDLYYLVEKLVENKIDNIIRTECREIKLSVGTKIKIKSKYCKLDDVYKEKLGVIINIIRFQDNTFNNGAYDVLFENISDTYRFYRKEFDIVEAIWVNERIIYIQ